MQANLLKLPELGTMRNLLLLLSLSCIQRLNTKWCHNPNNISMKRLYYSLSGLVVIIALLFIGSCTKTQSNLPPIASFTVSPPYVQLDTAVIFDASGTTDDYTAFDNLEFRWDYNNDGLWETEWAKTPIVTNKYLEYGYYTIGMEVKDQSGAVSWVSRNLTVIDSAGVMADYPVALFSINPQTGDVNTTFSFSAAASSDLQDEATLLQVRWDFDNNGSWDSDWSTEKTISHKYSTEGQYEVIMQVRDTDGNISGNSKTLYVGGGGGGLIELTFVAIPGGTFEMGCTQSNQEHCNTYDELPTRTTTVNAFQISKYEVTNYQFAGFLNDIGCSPNGSLGGNQLIFIGAENCQITYVGGVFRAVDGKYNAPVTQVTWEGAVEFCAHNGGKLPTEAEWEFVAKGGNNNENYEFSGSNAIEGVAWYAANSYAVTKDVGTKNANQLDIYDLSGNAQEWCSDWYDWEYYTTGNGDNPQGPETGEFRVVRGGSVYNGADDCRSSDRFWNDPKTSMPGLGFRVVK